MNTTSAVSVAFDPLLPWAVLIALGAVGLVLVLLGLRAARARHAVAARSPSSSCWRRSPIPP